MNDTIKLVTSLPFNEEVKQDSIKLLNEALIRAKAGEIGGVILITKDNDGLWSHRTTASLSIREEIGAIECLKWDRIYRSHAE